MSSYKNSDYLSLIITFAAIHLSSVAMRNICKMALQYYMLMNAARWPLSSFLANVVYPKDLHYTKTR